MVDAKEVAVAVAVAAVVGTVAGDQAAIYLMDHPELMTKLDPNVFIESAKYAHLVGGNVLKAAALNIGVEAGLYAGIATAAAEGVLLAVKSRVMGGRSAGIRYVQEGNSIFAYNHQGEQVGVIDTRVRGQDAVIDNVFVRESERGKGIGTTLTGKAENMATEKGATRMITLAQPDYQKSLEGKGGYRSEGPFSVKDLPDEGKK